MSHSFDVIVVGCGPSGATLANLLGLQGFKVAILDREKEIYDKPRAITADHEVMRIFQACGLSDAISRGTIAHPGTDYIGLENQIIKRFYPAPAPHPLSWEPTWMFVQPALETALRQGLQRFEQVRRFLGHELVDFKQHDGQVTATVRELATGQDSEIKGHYLVGCDGGRSTVRRLLGSTIEDLAFDEWWIVIDAWLRGDIDLPERATQYCHPWRPGTFIIGPGDLRRWEIKMLPHETPEALESDAAAMAVLGHFVDTSKLELYRKAVYRFHALVVDEWREGNVFLMGDAAHQTPPFMGQGLCAGVRDAANLAWKLEGVERHGYNRALLDSYTEERKPHVRTVVTHAKSFGLIIGEMDMDAARERDRRLGDELASGKAETIRQKFVPGLEAGVIHHLADGSLAPAAGDIFVQPWVRANHGQARLDDLIGPHFALVARSQEALGWLTPASRQALEQLGCRFVVFDETEAPALGSDAQALRVQEQDHLAATWFERWHARVAVLRPDRYVYGCADDAPTLNQVVQALATAVLASACGQPAARSEATAAR